MTAEAPTQEYEEIAHRYFDYIRELRTGVEGAPERLRDLWDEDGVFEFAGTPPVTGTFTGINAIYALYRNRFRASGMPVQLRGTGDKFPEAEGALGVVDTEVSRTRVIGKDKLVAGWTTVVGTEDRRGFQVAGSHTFTFKNGRISRLRIVVSPKPDAARELDLEGLGVEDIGRLALAAWMVV